MPDRTPSTNGSSASVKSTSSNEPLYQVKLLAALRSGDPALIQPFLTEIGRDRRTSTSTSKSNTQDSGLGASALHLAIRCASTETIALLLQNRAISPNAVHPPGSGTTSLHLAASLGRVDVVRVLLDQEGIDDTIRDERGRTCLEAAKGKAVVRLIEDSRAYLDAAYRSVLRTYVLSPPDAPPPVGLVSLLEAPRVKLVNLAYVDDSSGTTLLHEAARRKDLRLVELAVRSGADVFVRDRKGKSVVEVVGKDDRIKAFLRQFTNQDTTLIESAKDSDEPAVLKGYLNKYTNVAKGYGTRWFVLKDGVLSYYRHQEDETVASRGSIATKTAVLKVQSGGDKLRFEVHSTPSRGHSSVQKWYMKANHPVEAARWTTAIGKSITWEKSRPTQVDSTSISSSSTSHIRRPSIDSQESGTASISKSRTSLQSSFVRKRMESSLGSVGGSVNSLSGLSSGAEDAGSYVVTPRDGRKTVKRSGTILAKASDTEDSGSGEEVSANGSTPPHEDNFSLHGHATSAQLDLAAQLLSSLPSTSSANSPRYAEVKRAADEALGGARGMLSELLDMSRDREEWWKSKLKAERERQKVWEESLTSVVRDSAILESELRTQSRRRSRVSYLQGEKTPEGTLRQRPVALPPVGVPEVNEDVDSETVATGVEGLPSAFSPSPPPISPPPISPPPSSVSRATSPPNGPVRRVSASASGQITPTASRRFSMHVTSPTGDRDEFEDGDTDEEDEFFDAIEANALPNLVIPAPLASAGIHDAPSSAVADKADEYAAYANPRTRLGITSDDRPPMSLWAVLKNSIGKDLTKISFPVFFNEPTSMLQRMAEDMEFSECLDAAAAEKDPLRRIAYVAAFAMSNYSSTIGRIAKPFNPMLSETFEYVRLDKEYRYVSEQVSHHPPISACWSESPGWNYYGEVDAQNKFMGKSFEIRPTGVAHAEILLDEKVAPPGLEYPRAKGRLGEGKVVEHYSWKKVTTSVSGFLLGSPSIDHYGDMTVTNHRTGDTCILTFKPRGWRGKDAFEISGQVLDSRGKVVYEIAGRWNSQLVARAVGTGKGTLNPDISASSSSPEFILLWRNTVKPPAPFNLTPFAITLNDCPDSLKPIVAPTDCRVRPDQRAFEMGKYERANDLKLAQEEKQRTTRKAREDGREPPHKPRWFNAQTDKDTGERVWEPKREEDDWEVSYWAERRRVWNSGGKEGWSGVVPIFTEDEP